MQKDVLEDEVDKLQSEKDAFALDIDALNKEKKQVETAVKGLQKMCSNLTTQKSQLATDLANLQSLLSDGNISLAEYNQKKADMAMRDWLTSSRNRKRSNLSCRPSQTR